jgi:DNA-binding CsgD family transcriptional regulator
VKYQKLPALSPMQYKVFRMLCSGQRIDSIATQLGRSPFTIRNHLKAIFRTFNVHSQTELLAHAFAGGIISVRSPRHKNHRRRPRLAPRQAAVLLLVLQGLPLREIARRLGISPFTVKAHMKTLFKSFRVKSRTQLMVTVMHCRDRYLEPDDITARRKPVTDGVDRRNST